MSAAEVLLNPKILGAILRQIEPGPVPEASEDQDTVKERDERRKTLAQLACVCRATSEPALDALWWYVDDFRDLLRTLEAYDTETCMFRDTLTDDHWQRFQTYAARVRVLRPGELHRVHAAVWVALATRLSPHGAPLLPRLERLYCFMIDSLGPCYTMLFSPSLRFLDVLVDPAAEANAVRVVVQALAPVLASLHTLSVERVGASGTAQGLSENDGGTLKAEPEVIPFWDLTQLYALRVIHKVSPAAEDIHALRGMTNLRTLHLHIGDMPTLPPGPGAGLAPYFPALRELSLTGRLGAMVDFFAATAPPNLESLALDAPRLCDEEPSNRTARKVRSLDPLYALLTGTPLAGSLRHFRATLACPHGETGCPAVHLPAGTKLLQPLRALAGLRTVRFVCDNTGFHLSDKDLQELEDAWPELTALEVDTKERGNTVREYHERRTLPAKRTARDFPTVKTLAAFAQAHPRLERLVVPSIDLYAVPDVDSVPVLDHGLQHLGVSALAGGVPLYDFALALDKLFPRLRDLEDARKTVPNGTSDTRGDELRLLLLMLQTGRTAARRTASFGGSGGASDIRLVFSERPAEAGDGSAARQPHAGYYPERRRTRSRSPVRPAERFRRVRSPSPSPGAWTRRRRIPDDSDVSR
ncbi:hypothetical protein OH77DRAFT_1410076 [Trametes cingulata]|nr:hypothetical protein OH77DRAFT_1410076 [Trametes cingulata]